MVIMILLMMLQPALAGDSLVSPFNSKPIVIDDSLRYEFIVTGHLHGASTSRSGFPAASLLANLDTLNSVSPAFMISLGDLFLEVNEENIANYRKSFFSRINYPLFNAVGNHDAGKLYESRFGSTWSGFSIGSEMFIILDTEKDDGSITGEQYAFMEKQLKAAGNDPRVKNVFVFSHRPVWAEGSPRFKDIFSDNTRSAYSNNFQSEIKPLLIGIARVKSVYWMSGSMGSAPASFFYAKEDGFNLTFIQTAIRDLPRDAVLKVSVDNGTVKLFGVSFNGRSLKPVHEYNIDFWKTNTPAEEKFNYRLLPLMIKQTLTHRYFWFGTGFGIMLMIMLVLYSARRAKKQADKAMREQEEKLRRRDVAQGDMERNA